MSSEFSVSSPSLRSSAGAGCPPPSSRRRRWSSAQKQALLHEFAGSGLSATRFCRKRGLSAVTFSSWRRKFRVATGPAPAAFTRVRAVDDGASASMTLAVQVAGPGGFCCRVPAGCDPHWVAGLLRAVSSDRGVMFSLDTSTRVWLASGATDLRRGFNGLHALIVHHFGREALADDSFVFTNRRRDLLKGFFFDAEGLRVCAKRLERGTFRWPAAGEPLGTLSAAELQLLLGGLDPVQTRPRRWWSPGAKPGAATR